MSFRGWMKLTLVSAALAWISPQRAAACSCLPTPIHASEPDDGERDVALNQAIFIEGVFRADSARLEDESGRVVELERNAGPSPGCPGTSADLIPKSPLAPNTRYVVRVEPLFPRSVSPDQPSSLSFTTGTEMLPEVSLEPPHATASVLFDGPGAMCGGSKVYTCLGIHDPDDVELIARRGDEVLLRTTTLVRNDALYGLADVPDCVELRRRARTGRRSAPVTICGDALHARKWVASDSVQQVVQCRDGMIGASGAQAPGASEADPGRAGSNTAGAHAETGSGAKAGVGAETGAARAGKLAGSHATDPGPPPSAAGGCAATGGRGLSGADVLAFLALIAATRRRWRGARPRGPGAERSDVAHRSPEWLIGQARGRHDLAEPRVHDRMLALVTRDALAASTHLVTLPAHEDLHHRPRRRDHRQPCGVPVIFYANEDQRRVAQAYIEQLTRAAVFDAPIVTELQPLTKFYLAEAYHHDYAARNPNQPYIRGVSAPKVAKLEKVYSSMLKR